MNEINVNQNVNNTFKPFLNTQDRGISHFYLKQTMENDRYAPHHSEKEKGKKKGLLAIGTTAAIVTGTVFVALMTGKTQNISKGIKKALASLENKAATGKPHKYLTKFFKGLNKGGKVATNITPLKDWKFYEIMSSTNFTKKIWTKITNTYTRVNKNVVVGRQKKAVGSFNNFINDIEKQIQHTKKHDPTKASSETFKELEKLVQESKGKPREFFTEFDNRYQTMAEDMIFLKGEMKKRKFIGKDVIEGLITENTLAARKHEYVKALYQQKNGLSRSFDDLTQHARLELQNTNDLIYSIKKPKVENQLRSKTINLEKALKSLGKNGKETRKADLAKVQQTISEYKVLLKKEKANIPDKVHTRLCNQIDEFDAIFNNKTFEELTDVARVKLQKTNSLVNNIKDVNIRTSVTEKSTKLEEALATLGKNGEDTRKADLAAVKKAVDEYKALITKEKANVPEDLYKAVNKEADKLNKMFRENMSSKGVIQDIRTQVKKVYGDNSTEAINIKKSGQHAERELKKALDSEIRMYDKERDITVGSGPTDVLGLFAPAALFGVALSKDKTNDERVETTLTTGLPVLGGTGAYLWSVARQFSGGAALLFSIGTGVVLNHIGDTIFRKYKSYKENKHPQEYQTGIPNTHK